MVTTKVCSEAALVGVGVGVGVGDRVGDRAVTFALANSKKLASWLFRESKNRAGGLLLFSFFILGQPQGLSAKEYSLEDAVLTAQSHDPWIEGSQLKQKSLEALSLSEGALPDPSLSMRMANLPVDDLDLNREPMTQWQLGLKQNFPRGKTRHLSRQHLQRLSLVQPFMRENRKARTKASVSHLWLSAYQYAATIELIDGDRDLFEHLIDVAESNYASGSGQTRQGDVIRAQLELTRLEDRLIQLRRWRDTSLAELSQWLPQTPEGVQVLLSKKPALKIQAPTLIKPHLEPRDLDALSLRLQAHPRIKALEQEQMAGDTQVNLKKQSYAAQWGVEAQYGLRGADPMGSERSDFISLGLTVDLPLYGKSRQDNLVKSAVAEREHIKTERMLALQALRSGFVRAKSNYLHLKKRKVLFESRLLKEMADQAEASLSAYTNDEGDFAEVVRARISELNAKIEALQLAIELQKSIAELDYFLAGEVRPNP